MLEPTVAAIRIPLSMARKWLNMGHFKLQEPRTPYDYWLNRVRHSFPALLHQTIITLRYTKHCERKIYDLYYIFRGGIINFGKKWVLVFLLATIKYECAWRWAGNVVKAHARPEIVTWQCRHLFVVIVWSRWNKVKIPQKQLHWIIIKIKIVINNINKLNRPASAAASTGI